MIVFEPLDCEVHDRGGFRCGDDALDFYLNSTARQHADKGLSRTVVLVDDESPSTIIGYYTLAVCTIIIEEFPAEFRKKYKGQREFFGVKLGRVAVAENLQGRAYGKALIAHAMKGACSAAGEIGLAAFFVDAKSERLVSFYERFGFIRCCGNGSMRLFILTSTLRKAILDASSTSADI